MILTNPKKYQATALIDSLVGPVGFTVDPSCTNATIPAGGKLVCAVTYSPTAPGATLTITSNAGSSPQTVPISGTGAQGK